MEKKKEVQEQPKRLAILLRTLVNGYLLEVNDEGYMYYDAQSLLEGFIIHMGMGRLEEMTKREIKAMLISLKDGSVVKKLQAEVNSKNALITDLKKVVREQKRVIKELKEA
jgi:hypothetical protein